MFSDPLLAESGGRVFAEASRSPMTRADPETDDDCREAALDAVEQFRSRVMPGILRRMSIWKRLDARGQSDIAAEAMQELALDALANPRAVLALQERDRHTRWIRIVQHVHYSLRERVTRKRAADDALDEMWVEAPHGFELELSKEDEELLAAMLHEATHLKNGRLSLRATAKAIGVSPARLAGLRERVAEALGHDRERESLWRARLAEALTSMVAASLRAQGSLNLLEHDARRPFRLNECRDRLRRIRSALALSPIHPQAEQALALLLSGPDHEAPPLEPRELLRTAARLAPTDARIPLWQFEAEILGDDFAAAARCLRRARRLGAERTRIVLARARLLEARGLLSAARATLVRALRRRPNEPRLSASLAGIDGATSAQRLGG